MKTSAIVKLGDVLGSTKREFNPARTADQVDPAVTARYFNKLIPEEYRRPGMAALLLYTW